jgi:hypothetical protein
MGYKCDRVFVYPSEGEPEEFVFIDLSKTTSFNRIGRSGYNCVSFRTTGPKDLDMNYPIVLDDFTATSYPFDTFINLTEIDYPNVPSNIKRKFTRWVKFQ